MHNSHTISRRSVLQSIGGLTAAALVPGSGFANEEQSAGDKRMPLYVFCGTGDHLWGSYLDPVDSPATIEAMFEWMSDTYGISRVYWRGGQTMMWDRHYNFITHNLQSADWTQWKRHLYRDLKINEAAVKAAHDRGMEAFIYTGLFEFGVQPDVGVIGPYPFEDEVRVAHPEWCPVDRWGQRRCPGPISFCYPEARKLIIDRYISHIDEFGYDGINFYTYVENCGIRYEDEFGFNQPIIDEFNKRYPDVDLCRDKLTEEHKHHWYACRGKFVTDFLRELQAELSKRGKTLSVIIDSKNPDYAQPWWSQKVAGTGIIKMDWQTWVREGIVQELWVQLGPSKNQCETLDTLEDECRQHNVKLTVRTIDPFENTWRPYVEKGVTPVAVITWQRNGIERITHRPTDAGSFSDTDWKLRLQALKDVESGTLEMPAETVASLTTDPHVLVRRRTMHALKAMKAKSQVAAIEGRLFDEESSVRIAAANVLATVNSSNTAQRIVEALQENDGFQFKLGCVEALTAIGESGLAIILKGTEHTNYAVRETCIRSLAKICAGGLVDKTFPVLSEIAGDNDEDEKIRCYALEGDVNSRLKLNRDQQSKLIRQLINLTDNENTTLVQLRATWGLGHVHGICDQPTREEVVSCLARGFRKYGDGCQRDDAAYGWRLFGNALLNQHSRGRNVLESFRKQTDDKWLAWLAYEVVYLPHRFMKIELIEEETAIEQHKQFAPAFPGYRS
jgi:hypothetical protein